MEILLNLLVSFGLVAVGICFIILLPTVGQTLVGVFSAVLGEQAFSFLKRQESGTVVRRVDNPGPVIVPDVEEEHDDHHHEPASLETYLGVYGALLVLTVATVGVSELGMVQRHAIFWALVVASMKASLVIAWFMHVKGGPSSTHMILGTSAFFMVVFFTLTMADLSTRDFAFAEEGHETVVKEAVREGRTAAGWSDYSGGPTFISVEVTPSTAHEGSTLTCSAKATDLYGEAKLVELKEAGKINEEEFEARRQDLITLRWSDGTDGRKAYNVTRFDRVGGAITCTAIALDEVMVEGSKVAYATVVETPDPT